ncbi:Sec62/63 complex, subunit Sec66 [Linnemannia elongata]|nr:translocation protein S66 [Linnemannia elongata]KAG0061232.1 translocation protein S66 [Linnemannia elongata]KAH7047654.1 Sec62/63 complex, subunit Sec66 [Linnemannia elongata]KAK5821619.1 Sec62/63 complex, subunit Sec66 [Linnemannia elongata]
MGSVWLAIIYIGGWILSMRIFGYFWKNRKLAINDAEPWFGENIARSQYIALLQQEEPEATETQLTAALLRRAMEGVVRVLSMREDKQVLANLVKQGTVGDDIWTQFTLSEKELEAEIMAIVEEANTFKENWGQSILQTASEMVMHEKTKQMQKELEHRKEEEARKQAVRDQRKEKNKALKEKKEGTAAPVAAAKESTTDAPAPATAAAEVEASA